MDSDSLLTGDTLYPGLHRMTPDLDYQTANHTKCNQQAGFTTGRANNIPKMQLFWPEFTETPNHWLLVPGNSEIELIYQSQELILS